MGQGPSDAAGHEYYTHQRRDFKDYPIQTYTAAVALQGAAVSGTIKFTQKGLWGPVQITGQITGLDPNSERGMHVHEFGDITNGCNSTGTHFNPFKRTHGAPGDAIRHVGDLGNIQSDANGVANLDFSDSIISLKGIKSIVGRAIVVHTGTDDLGKGGNDGSLTTGNAGGRAACGVIGLSPVPTP
ncbi:Superoxide dismutase [Cu-Zn] [Serendipita sp. 411]|nr:Superoxide dismutase [Cu-Zn] [Serendipita sp. 401]KAG8847643.1 Superoxide dismutase [Cu-Zn] [Serendipita sp. 411]KAG9055204.1 Superoxide dismutase [Cu-Zn] [Serendipita sp. 407]